MGMLPVVRICLIDPLTGVHKAPHPDGLCWLAVVPLLCCSGHKNNILWKRIMLGRIDLIFLLQEEEEEGKKQLHHQISELLSCP